MCDLNFIAFIARDDGGKERASARVDGIRSVTRRYGSTYRSAWEDAGLD